MQSSPLLAQAAALIYGLQPHHLDHLAPLAVELAIPLVVTEQKLATLAQTYYPGLSTTLIDPLQLGEVCLLRYDTLFSSLPRATLNHIFFLAEHLHQKQLRAIWCPHGNSDKGHRSFWMEGLKEETFALLYGKKMAAFLQEKGAYHQLNFSFFTGNYRYRFYRKRAPFYDALARRQIFSQLPANQLTLLYAPTWQDSECSSSFWTAFPFMVEHLPKAWNLIVKLHPNLVQQCASHPIETLIERAQEKKNIVVLSSFPPIYPLLNGVDLYIGDFSSVGYDCLTFNKPMFFLNELSRDPVTDPGLALFRCGHSLSPSEYPSLFDLIAASLPDDQKKFKQIRCALYDYVFEPCAVDFNLKSNLERALDEHKNSSRHSM